MKLQKYSEFSFLMKMMCLFALLFLGHQLRQPSAAYAKSDNNSGSSFEKTEIKASNMSVSTILVADKLSVEKSKN